mmetsp:Transcript_62661/g.139532  ORF Transcript_62661/g.139532 Transcript_62661/m.139532 type:complete len:174 (-) Transcript_62661:291-812(-)|eukprot:CAMPEP_0181207158 /NCGR_PEP_ID=MMETSP1096-20121128/21432_1 /TAXON_ID=156174 ORGANISM="Chrysochromulina ericina, Strain CCMP281" /NCGR_SAMPLE_ID=MMETSP1096 /ASSEMBLY_ACC=CAM_ASM_000453 /LENGTH=173 /DNA_ID=CAMNT_0023298131 /DNA_START=88 /DNA_END=609 /DNA_ORIENTATION=-
MNDLAATVLQHVQIADGPTALKLLIRQENDHPQWANTPGPGYLYDYPNQDSDGLPNVTPMAPTATVSHQDNDWSPNKAVITAEYRNGKLEYTMVAQIIGSCELEGVANVTTFKMSSAESLSSFIETYTEAHHLRFIIVTQRESSMRVGVKELTTKDKPFAIRGLVSQLAVRSA